MKEDHDNSFCRPESAFPFWVADGIHPAVVRTVDVVRDGDKSVMIVDMQPFGYPRAEDHWIRDQFLVTGFPKDELEPSRMRERAFVEAVLGSECAGYTVKDLVNRVVRVETITEELVAEEGVELISVPVAYDRMGWCGCQYRFKPVVPDFVDSDGPRLDSANPGSRNSSAKVGDDPQTQIASSDSAKKSGG
jgi:hypothetical protein